MMATVLNWLVFILLRQTEVFFITRSFQDNFSGKIEFEDVHFAYPTRANRSVLNHFDLTCQQGQTTALVGFSGCG